MARRGHSALIPRRFAHLSLGRWRSPDTLASHPLELVHSDVLTVDTASLAGKRYVITFVDNFSRRLWVEPIDRKFSVFEAFKRFKAAAETESGHKLQRFRSDNGSEYSSRTCRVYLDEYSVAFESRPPYSPASNGIAEQVNRSILKGIRTMLHQAGGKVPLPVWRDHPVRIDMLRVWGCRAWHTLANTKSKLDARAIPLVFVGYEGDTKVYHLLDPAARWLDAEKGEFFSLLNDYKVFHPVDRSTIPPTAKILGSHFHYRHKGYGTTRVLKVRLVAQGYNQHPGLNFRETFAPVTKFTSIRVLLALAAQQRMHIQQADIDKVYLHADLDKELYMRVPGGVNGPKWDGKVLKLDRALYDLKQAGCARNAKIHMTLERLGHQRTVSNICIYVRCEGGQYHYIALYVDDLLFVSHLQVEIDRVKGGLREQYGIKDLSDASCILGIDLVHRPDGSVFLWQ
ncbi:hypothetical protein JCM1840_003286 [Sporobolomyces johnsonii]